MSGMIGSIAFNSARQFTSYTIGNNPADTVLTGGFAKRSVGGTSIFADPAKVTAQMAANSFVTLYEEFDGSSVFTQYIRAGTYTSSGTITLGSAVTVDTNSNRQGMQIRKISDTKGIIIWDEVLPSTYNVYGQHFTLSGSTITLNTKVTLYTGYQNARLRGFEVLDSARAVLFYANDLESSYHRYQLVDISGTNCAVSGSPITGSVLLSTITGYRIYKIADNTLAVNYYTTSENQISIVTIVGSTITEGTLTQVSSGSDVRTNITIEPQTSSQFIMAVAGSATASAGFIAVNFSGTTVTSVGAKTNDFGWMTTPALKKLPNNQILAAASGAIAVASYTHLLGVAGSTVSLKHSAAMFTSIGQDYQPGYVTVTSSLALLIGLDGTSILSRKITLT